MSSSAVKAEQIWEIEESGDARGQGSAPRAVVSSTSLAGHIGEEADSRSHEETMVGESAIVEARAAVAERDVDEMERAMPPVETEDRISTVNGPVSPGTTPGVGNPSASGAGGPSVCGTGSPSPSVDIVAVWMDRFRH